MGFEKIFHAMDLRNGRKTVKTEEGPSSLGKRVWMKIQRIFGCVSAENLDVGASFVGDQPDKLKFTMDKSSGLELVKYDEEPARKCARVRAPSTLDVKKVGVPSIHRNNTPKKQSVEKKIQETHFPRFCSPKLEINSKEGYTTQNWTQLEMGRLRYKKLVASDKILVGNTVSWVIKEMPKGNPGTCTIAQIPTDKPTRNPIKKFVKKPTPMGIQQGSYIWYETSV